MERMESSLKLLQEEASAELPASVSNMVANLKKRCNTVISPIYQLPVEILVEILFLAIEASDRMVDGRDKARTGIMNVSWYWFDTVLSTPLLSSFLINSHPINKTKHFIELSKDGTLDIACLGYTQQDEFMRLVLPHIHRWRSFYWGYQAGNCRDLYIPKVSAPLLEVFQLKGHRGPVGPNLFDGNAPRLRVLDILPAAIPFNHLKFSKLTDLVVTDAFGEDPDWRSRYDNLFRSLPFLEHVHIRLLRERLSVSSKLEGVIQPKLSVEPIVLSRLKTMDLEDLPPRIAITLLSSIIPDLNHPHPCLYINFTHSGPLVFKSVLLAEPNTVVPSFLPLLTAFYIWFHPDGEVLRLRGLYRDLEVPGWTKPAPFMFRFDGLELPLSPAADSLIKQLLKPNFTKLTLRGQVDFEAAGLNLSAVFSLLPRLKVLRLQFTFQDSVHKAFDLLQAPCGDRELDEANDEWRCPRLERLMLYGVNFEPDRLHTFISSRYGPNSMGNKDSLKELEISYCGPAEKDGLRDTMAKIEHIVQGQGGVVDFEICKVSTYADYF
ncbi:hypothetical protein FRC02_005772 [Tulasnella sp. 418]|nr:hypothetical protein FRC02_005772 [Tulasnella sp. 418]